MEKIDEDLYLTTKYQFGQQRNFRRSAFLLSYSDLPKYALKKYQLDLGTRLPFYANTSHQKTKFGRESLSLDF